MAQDKYTLNPRQKAFVEAYMRTYSPKKAALEAGYSANCPAKVGWQALQSPGVQKAIKEEIEKRKKALDLVPFDAIATMLVEACMDPNVSLKDRMKAADLLMKYKQHNKWGGADVATVDKYVDALKGEVGNVWSEEGE